MSVGRTIVTVTSLALWASSVAAQPAHPGPPAPDRETLLKRAAAELAAGRPVEAAQLLRSAAHRFQSVRALVQLSEIQSGGGDNKGALESLKMARTLAPNAESVLDLLARLSLAEHELRLAIAALEPLARMHPAVANYQQRLGAALAESGDLPAGIASLRRAQELDPNNASTLVALGTALNRAELYPDARTALLRSLEFEPESVDAAAALAEAEAGTGDLQAAEAHAQAILTRSSGHATAALAMGMVRLKQGRFGDARDLLEMAAASSPGSARVHEQLALAYAALGDDASARRERALSRPPAAGERPGP
jgi:tetratricopeptide (TPR) repeat protein